ncbi:hypothetical protein [Cyanobium gracile]|uniref:Uncharacterized protein n=1 Tax=Cyanobium gracile UHCC 0281 TaxID=3110309 RepID=A0ABU5SU86_9CYAN|nr:hypothetical protein [Cyanobium gracile]MEA5442088.1 hypothetical protein [Cyanobium gracile UHCC 0281]
MSILIPQLPDSAALPIMAEMALCSDPSTLEPTGELKNSQAYVMATGGFPVEEPALKLLRHLIVAAARQQGFPERRPRSFLEFEFQVAEILGGWEPLWIDDVPSGESLRNACWTFLTVVVLPDVAIWRWPPSAVAESDKAWKGRVLGGGRNAFQRIHRRVLSLDRGPVHPDRWGLIRELKEDDFSNILERPTIGSNPHVAVCLAEEYLAMRERLSGCSAEIQTRVYREATKDLRAYGVVQPLDLLPREELGALIRRTFLRREEMYGSAHLGQSELAARDPSVHNDPRSNDSLPAAPSDSSDQQSETPQTSEAPTLEPPSLLRRLFGGA